VRYADGPTVEVEVHIDAPPAAVWPVVRDITTPARFSEELQEVRRLEDDDDGDVARERFAGRNHHPAIGEWETTCTVTVDDPERVFEWAVGDAEAPSASWRFTLEPDGVNGTVLRQWMRIGPAPSGLTPAIEAMPDKEERIIARRLDEHRANMQRTVDGIRALVESTPGEM
jgi:hypothetical protein